MTIDRVSTASLYQQNLSDIAVTQTNLATLNQQISSGNIANTWDQLNGSVEQVSGFTTQISDIDNYTANNTVISTRLNAMDQATSDLQNIATQYASLIAERNSGTNNSDLNFATQANSMLSQIAQDLNTSISGRYLFGGSKTDSAPVTQPIPDPTTPGTLDANYYNGSSDQLTARISDSQDIQYGVPANDPAFQNLIGAIKAGIAGDASNSSSLLDQSVDMTNTAVQGLADVRTGIDTNITNITNVTNQQASMKIYWQQALSTDTSTDIASASIQLSADQTTLQATFQAFASLTKLTLANYLTS